jgi:site-specific recombinase XerC
LRVSELVGLDIGQFDGRSPASIHVMGKGRRERVLPLWQETVAAIRAWITVRPAGGDTALFLNNAGRAMTRSGLSIFSLSMQSWHRFASHRLLPRRYRRTFCGIAAQCICFRRRGISAR